MHNRRFDYDTIDSTSERAFESIADGSARDGDVHVARAQTKGRGTRGRAWFSAPGEGLYMSVVRLPQPPPLAPAALTMAAGLAVLDAVRRLGLANAELKWPNDVVAGGAKLAGVLVETRGLEPTRPHYVLGIGVNVRQRSFPPELAAERRVTSLALSGVDCSVEEVLLAILASLPIRWAQASSGHRRLEADFVESTGLRDRGVRVQVGSQAIEGALFDLSLRDGLALRLDDASERRVPLESVLAIAERD